ncbi:MAG TPA: C1 family peptidase, partial [Polyangium sp.]|nr:C1 family peptidase [Polyangium sp.]
NDLGALTGRSLTVEQVWPFDRIKACRLSSTQHGGDCQSELGVFPGSGINDPYLLGEKARADSYGTYRIDALEHMGPEHIDQIALLLAEGEAIWISLAFNDRAWRTSSVTSGYLPYYPPQEGVGHAVVLQGYRMGPTGREFLFQNSWGTDWGLGGYLWIPDSMLRTHMRRAYRVRMSDAGGPPSVPPSGPMPSIPSSPCPAGQVSVFGLCLPMLNAPAGQTPSPGGLPKMLNCPPGSIPNLLAPGQCIPIQ